MMGDASKNFDWREFACPCCGKNLTSSKLVEAVQQIRDLVGPVRINSGYRCPQHNAAVGGAKHSRHLLGTAADIKPLQASMQDVLDAALTIGEFAGGGIGVYRTFIHVDLGRARRWGRVNGEYVSWAEALSHYGLVEHIRREV